MQSCINWQEVLQLPLAPAPTGAGEDMDQQLWRELREGNLESTRKSQVKHARLKVELLAIAGRSIPSDP